MKKQVLWVLILCALVSTTVAQNFSDQATAGFDNARTYANNGSPSLKPPLRLFDTVELTGAETATSLAVFEGRYLVGKGDGPANYQLFNAAGVRAWTVDFLGGSGPLNYVPAYAQGIALLGGEGTTSVTAIRVADGAVLWSAAVGPTAGRNPVLTDDLAIFAGESRVVAANASTGTVFWQVPTSTAEAPLAVFGNRVYFICGGSELHALDLRTGAEIWATPNVASDGASLLATEDYVFVTSPDREVLDAFNTRTGARAWSSPVSVPGEFPTSNALAFGAGRLIVFRSDDGDENAAVEVYDPRTGSPMWAVTEPGAGIEHGFLVNHVVYYYHQPTGRIRARDIFSGTLLWSIHRAGVDVLTAAQDSLIALVDGDIEIYRHSPEAFLAQMASGMGQTTLLAVSNVGLESASVTIEFFDDNGTGLAVPVQGVGSVDRFLITVPPGASRRVQVNQVSSGVVTGWVRVTATQPVRVSSIYQFSPNGGITHEAGVGDAAASGSGNVLVTIDEEAGFNTAIAIANPSEEAASVTLTLLNAQGQPLDETTIQVPSLGHIAQFVGEWFDIVVPAGGFEGTLVFESDVPVTLAALRTKDLLQMSSYPVGQAVK